MADTQIVLVVDPLYDKDILEWVASFKPEDRSAALLMAIRGGMAAEEVSVDGLEKRLEQIQSNIAGFRDELALLHRDVKNMKYVAANANDQPIPGEQIDLIDIPEVVNVLNKLVEKGS